MGDWMIRRLENANSLDIDLRLDNSKRILGMCDQAEKFNVCVTKYPSTESNMLDSTLYVFYFQLI